MPQPPQNLRDFKSLVKIIEQLRGPEGCPWDKEQDHQSLTRFAIEEAYELADACDQKDTEHMKEELGDLLLQVVLHSEIARQDGNFEISDVIETLSEKMIRRHPHVFSSGSAENSRQVEASWEEIKRAEKKDKKQEEEEEEQWIELPRNLSPMLAAFKIGKKSKKYDFDWPDYEGVLAKVKEELAELEATIGNDSDEEQLHELGDLLFSVVQLARHLELDSEEALRKCNRRFLSRVDAMMGIAKDSGKDWMSLPSEEKEELWAEAKKRQKLRNWPT